MVHSIPSGSNMPFNHCYKYVIPPGFILMAKLSWFSDKLRGVSIMHPDFFLRYSSTHDFSHGYCNTLVVNRFNDFPKRGEVVKTTTNINALFPHD